LLPLPLSRLLYEKLVEEFDIAPSYLSVLSTGVATYISPSTKTDNSEREHARKRIIILQSTNSDHKTRVCHSAKHSLFVLLDGHHIQHQNRQNKHSDIWSSVLVVIRLFACLSSVSLLLHGPMFVPAVALELQARWFNETVSSCHSRVYDIETTTGMRRFESSQNNQRPEIQDWKAIDLIDITRDLNSLLTRVAFLRLQCETGVSFTQQMQVSIDSLKSVLQISQAQYAIETQDDTISKLEHLHSWYSGMIARLRYLTERIEGQIHTVQKP
jgi:hypothetical protein